MTPIPPEDSAAFQSGLNPTHRDELHDMDEARSISNEQPDDLVTVATFMYAHEAELGRVHLEEAGLRGFIADAETAAMTWMFTKAIGEVKLQVARRDLTMATDILSRHPSPARDDEDDTTDEADVESACLSCGAAISGTASRCPSCGWSYEGDETGITDSPPQAQG